jgi:hypothetical protein
MKTVAVAYARSAKRELHNRNCVSVKGSAVFALAGKDGYVVS